MIWPWIGFNLFIILLLALDLGFLNRRPRPMTLQQSLGWSFFWILLALTFTAVIYDGYENHRFGLGWSVDAVDGRLNDGASAVSKYLAGYILEKSLSADNLFVIAVIFRFLAVPPEHQHRVLFWGILGALLLRGLMIGAGVELVRHYHWVLYIFGILLLITGVRLLVGSGQAPDVSRNPILRLARRFLPVSDSYHGGRFWSIEHGRRVLTPLVPALLLIETSDLIFATDSIPAVFGVTADPLLVFTSNIFAVLGLRSLYFALAGLIERFRYLKVSLAIILVVIGVKMLAARWIGRAGGDYAGIYLLGLVVVLLGAGIIASLAGSRKHRIGVSPAAQEETLPST